MRNIFAQKKMVEKPVGDRIMLQFGKGPFKRQIHVTQEQKKEIDTAFKMKIPMPSEQLVFGVLSLKGKTQQAKL